jgi:antirestriction protein ArdC
MSSERRGVYTRITNKIIADLEQSVRTWTKPWNAGITAGRITMPLRHNGTPYSGSNILMLCALDGRDGQGLCCSHLDDV